MKLDVRKHALVHVAMRNLMEAANALEKLGEHVGWAELTDMLSGLGTASSIFKESCEVAAEDLRRSALADAKDAHALYYGKASGSWSATSPQLQQIPREKEHGKA